MADAKFSWYGNFYGIAWRTHAGNPIAVPLFVKQDESQKIADIIKTWKPKDIHLTFIEKDDGNYAICIYQEADSGENIGLYRSGMSQTGTYGKIKQMIEKKSSMWNPLRAYIQIVYATDPADSKTYQNMTDYIIIGRLEIISEDALKSKRFVIEKDAHTTLGGYDVENTTDEN
ncbi:hypothetical protein [Nitrosopumilus maritimus]|uniref:Uncharacterized protein n=1 Tax=Nitrosopumilus maritimus (strain SCM1) TaxID=436308 RepID=A9A561_NITMS|nr:hypothetical protein [Nitrosopumilus maritimus]ABX12260.1 hypothetical protein Nmar_0364 [Nitrosopumilus maritimus SCM1]